MSDSELEKIKAKKVEVLMKQQEVLIKQQNLPNIINKIHTFEEFNKLVKNNDKMIIIDFSAI